MKFGVVVFPGSNCDKDMIYVLETLYKQEVVKLWHKDTELQNCDFIILPGGFSYGDYLRSGAIARFSPIMEKVIEFANKGGYVMGVCNGFQILWESGLLPGETARSRIRTGTPQLAGAWIKARRGQGARVRGPLDSPVPVAKKSASLPHAG